MRVDAPEELAMILPIPVPTGSPDDAVKFINLEKYPTFFWDLDLAFPRRIEGIAHAPAKATDMKKSAPLEVVEVGSFVASFVPKVEDFDRLDERFRLPKEVWAELPKYRDFGFAVFQLKPGHKKVHPMAFEFPRRDPEKLFFPTVHIHDGKVHPRARFDHTLFCQRSGNEELIEWTESPGIARSVIRHPDVVKNLIDFNDHLYKRELRGMLPNRDILV
jgi:hypothetical protein